MKQYILSIVSLFFLLVGCQQEELIEQQGTGYLSLESLTLQAVSHQPVTRAGVEEGLGFKVVDANGGVVDEIDYAPNADYTSKLFELPAGNYRLIAYNRAYLDYQAGTTWTNSELGEAIHYIETSFTIEADKTNYLKVEVPMTNFAVCLESIQGEEFFQKFELVVTVGERVLWLKKGDVGYFLPVKGDETLSYCISYTNDDGEGATGDAKTLPSAPAANTQYNFVYNIETETLEVQE